MTVRAPALRPPATAASLARLGTAAALLLGAVLSSPATLAAQPGGRLQASVSPSRVVFPSPGVPEFEAGEVRSGGVSVDVRTRGFVLWVLTIRAEGPDLGGYGKPLSDLQWRRPGDDWQPVSTSEQVVAFGFRSRRIDLDFRTLLRWARDAPDRYGTGLTFRVASLFGNARLRAARPADGAASGVDPAAVCARVAVGMGGEAGSADRAPRRVERRCRADLPDGLRRLTADEIRRRASGKGGR